MTPLDNPGAATLRPAVVADLDGITEVENASFVHAGERFNNNRVQYLIVNPRSTVTVAERAGRLLGWAAGVVWTRGPVPWGRVYALAVGPQARGQRLGATLLADMIRSLRGAERSGSSWKSAPTTPPRSSCTSRPGSNRADCFMTITGRGFRRIGWSCDEVFSWQSGYGIAVRSGDGLLKI